MDPFQARTDAPDAITDHAGIQLDLFLAGAAHGDATALSVQVGPAPRHARLHVAELRELDLEFAFACGRTLGEDVQYQP